MTKEEAINILNREFGDSDNEVFPEVSIALDMAIKALEQEVKTEKVIKMRDATPEERESINKYIKSISKPTVVNFDALEQEPKTGRWIKYSIPRCGEQHYACTSCGYYINFGQWGELYTKEFKYCPNCGIKMEEQA